MVSSGTSQQMLMEDEVRQVMSRVLKIPAHQIDASVSADTVSAWDSLQHINLILALEEAFDVRFSVDDIGLITSYPEILKVLERHMGTAPDSRSEGQARNDSW